MSLSQKAQELHTKMLQAPPGEYFAQKDLEGLIGIANNNKYLLDLIQELLNFQMVKLVTQNGILKFAAVAKTEADKVSKMTEEEKMIYSQIEAAGRNGIWQKIIKLRTNLHQYIFAKSLKALEQKRYVKSIRDVKHPTRKIYMLYNLQPSVELTGGPWFTDSELDTEFVESLLSIVWRFICTKSYPNPFPGAAGPSESTKFNLDQASYSNGYDGYPTLEDILKFIKKSGVTSVELALSDIQSLCDVLMFEDKIEKISMNLEDAYRATWQSVLEAGGGVPEGTNPMELKETYFSLFDFYTQMPPSEDDPDVGYLDHWINN